jgi:thermitase
MIPGSEPSVWRRAALLWWSVAVMFLSVISCRISHAQAVYVPDEVLVSLTCGATCGERVSRVAAAVGMLIESEPRVGICRVRIRPELTVPQALAILRSLPEVQFAEPNLIHEVAAVVPNDSQYKAQWAPRQIQADLAWQIWRPRVPVVIAVIDSGIDSTHPDLAAKILRDEQGIVGYDAELARRSDAMDDFFHGTHVAGIAAAHTNNGLGIAGIAGLAGGGGSDADTIKLMPVKVLDRLGRGSVLSVARGITWAADQGAQVLNLSLGASSSALTLTEAVKYALGKGCVIVAAAGNSGLASPNYPAATSGVISVAATDQKDTLTRFSSWGAWVAVAAPGDGILSTTPTYPTGQGVSMNYASMSGTSMACPHVAGEAALLLSHNPNLTAQDVVRLITRNVDPYLPYQDHTLGPSSGRVNVNRALRAADVSAPTSGGLFLNSLSLSAAQIEGGATVTATVTLQGTPSSSGQVVTLYSSDASLAVIPENVVIPPGELSATFPIATKVVTSTARVTLSAAFAGANRSVSLDLIPQPGTLDLFTLSPVTVQGGVSSRATLRVTTPAPKGGLVVQLDSSHPDAAAVPASVTVPAGQRSAAFTITTRAVGTTTPVTIGAAVGGSRMEATLTVKAPEVASLILRPNLIRGQRSLSAGITLSAPAPSGGLAVSLSTSHPDLISLPVEVIVPAGTTSTLVTIGAEAVSVNMQATITATTSGTSRTATLWLMRGL